MATIRILLGIICLAITGWGDVYAGCFLAEPIRAAVGEGGKITIGFSAVIVRSLPEPGIAKGRLLWPSPISVKSFPFGKLIFESVYFSSHRAGFAMTDLWLDCLKNDRTLYVENESSIIDFGTVSTQYRSVSVDFESCLSELWTVSGHGPALMKPLCSPVKNFVPPGVSKPHKSAVGSLRSRLMTNQKILSIARSQIGVREATGHNDGGQVQQYLHYVGFKKGAPWCAAFVSWVFGRAGFDLPRTAWSPALFPAKRLTKNIQAAAVFGIYFPDLKRIAHCGLVERKEGHWLRTIEGNTNLSGSREGDGVYRKLRHSRSIYAYADWLGEEGGIR